MDKNTSIEELKNKVKEFCEERDWNQFHNPKELAIGISSEAGELLQMFRFKNEEQMKEMFENKSKKEEITEEVADVLYFTLRFAEMNNIDLTTALIDKIEKNHKKYPVEKVKGNNNKYNEY